ncbi:hypothetical protein A5N82_13955 [Christensenella minuta]|nr:hypothetical protein B1H56_14260 [Christensenella minuta]OAQ37603.1 hypothetical protein A5N82_13955 [Christensenella minuta]
MPAAQAVLFRLVITRQQTNRMPQTQPLLLLLIQLRRQQQKLLRQPRMNRRAIQFIGFSMEKSGIQRLTVPLSPALQISAAGPLTKAENPVLVKSADEINAV